MLIYNFSRSILRTVHGILQKTEYCLILSFDHLKFSAFDFPDSEFSKNSEVCFEMESIFWWKNCWESLLIRGKCRVERGERRLTSQGPRKRPRRHEERFKSTSKNNIAPDPRKIQPQRQYENFRLSSISCCKYILFV